jgi:hypothetical protein
VAIDGDIGCVDQHYRALRAAQNRSVLPLRMDLLNPSAGGGFHLTERESVIDRGPADLVLALALLHHLRITGRVPLARIAEFLASLGRTILIEFVPVSDPMAKRLLGAMEATQFEDYTREGFLDSFGAYFDVSHCADLPGCDRSLWVLRNTARGARV